MRQPLSPAAAEQIFREARTANKFIDQPISDDLLQQLYELYKWGPTSMNCQPARVVFLRSPEAKLKIKNALMPGNVDKTMAAPVVAVVAYDKQFYEQLPTQLPQLPMAREMFAANPMLATETALRNSSLQGAYLIIAARLLGLDAGAMSGFHTVAIDAALFPDGRYTTNFLINLGYADPTGNYPRGPRLAFADAVQIQ